MSKLANNLPSNKIINSSVSNDGNKIACYKFIEDKYHLCIIHKNKNSYELQNLGFEGIAHEPIYAPVWSICSRFVILESIKNNLIKVSTEDGSRTFIPFEKQGLLYPIQMFPSNNNCLVLAAIDGGINYWEIDIQNGNLKQLTFNYIPSKNCVLSLNGEWLLYSNNTSEVLHNEDIHFFDLINSVDRVFYSSSIPSIDQPIDFSHKNNLLGINSQHEDFYAPFVLNLNNGEKTNLASKNHDSYFSCFSDDGSKAVTIVNEYGKFIPIFHDFTNKSQYKINSSCSIYKVQKYGSENYLLSMIDDFGDATIAVYNYQNKNITYFDCLSSKNLNIKEFGKIVDFGNSEIGPIHGIWYDVKNNKSKKVILALHGGPHSQWLKQYEPITELSLIGFDVVLLNQIGSTGYGIQYKYSILNDWGGLDYNQVLFVINKLVSMGYEYSNIFLYGHSYGAYLALLTSLKINHTLGGVLLWAPITDLGLLYKESPGVRYLLRSHLGSFNDNSFSWSQKSPINFAHNVKMPTVFIHGENDQTIPYSQTEVFYSASNFNPLVSKKLISNLGHYTNHPLEMKKIWNQIFNIFENNFNKIEKNEENYA